MPAAAAFVLWELTTVVARYAFTLPQTPVQHAENIPSIPLQHAENVPSSRRWSVPWSNQRRSAKLTLQQVYAIHKLFVSNT
jgi:hypothetical protein